MIDQLEAVDGLFFAELDFNDWAKPASAATESLGQTFTVEGHLVTAANARIEFVLPSLLLTFENKIANKKIFKEPSIKIIPREEDEEE